MTRKDTFVRAAFTTWALVVAVIAACTARAADSGWCFTALMVVVAVLLVADLVINDFMPARFVFKWALEWRKWTYTVASFSYASHLFVTEQSSRSVQVDMLVIYSSMAICGLMLSFRNLFHVRGRACNEQ
jgi:hypothetical protein